MNTKRVRSILIGYGYWGANLLRNMMSNPGLEVVAVIEPNPEAQKRCQALYPQLHIASDLSQILKSEKPDAAVIATPPATHADLAIECLRAGCHVLLEKPMAVSEDECERILAEAQKVQRHVMVDHTFVYHPAVTYLAAQIHSGAMGRLQFFDSIRINLGGFQMTNALWDLAPHDLSILDLFTQGRMPSKVTAVGVRHFGSPSESMAYATLVYDGEFIAHLHLNWAAPVKVRQVTIGGTEKMAVYDDNLPTEKVRIYDRGVQLSQLTSNDLRINYRIGDMVAPAILQTEALSTMIEDFVSSIREGRAPRSDGAFGTRVVRILEALSQSLAAGGDPVELPTSGWTLGRPLRVA